MSDSPDSPPHARARGYRSPEELVGKPSIEFYLEAEQKEALLKELMEKGYDPDFEGRIKMKDGTHRYIKASFTIQKNKEGNILRTEGIFRDITERKRMEKELEESRKHFKKLFNLITDPVCIVDKKGKFLDVTNRVEEITGYKKEELIGRNFFETKIVTMKSKAILIKNLAKRMMRMHIAPYEIEVLTKDGRKLPYEVHAEKIDYKGKHADMVVFKDISERKQMEEKLREYTEHLEELVEEQTKDLRESEEALREVEWKFQESLKSTESGCWDWNIVTSDLWWSEGIEPMFELEKEEFGSTYEAFLALVHEEDRELVVKAMNFAIEEGTPYAVDHRIAMKNGNVKWVAEKGVVLRNAEGKAVRMLGTVTDITERKRLEETLRKQNIQLKKLDEMKSHFMSMATHELRTPLVSIKGYTELIRSGRVGEVPERLGEMLKVVERNADRLSNLTDDLLDQQRLESGQLTISPENLKLQSIIKEVVEEVQPFILEKNQVLNIQVPDVLAPVKADKNRMTQVLLNLLNNASKFSPPSGSISLQVREISEMVEVQVSDSGIGIAKEDMDKLFKSFPGIQKTGHHKGTGLGLSICKGIIDLHGGRIWAESEGDGRGAKFTFTIPKQSGD